MAIFFRKKYINLCLFLFVFYSCKEEINEKNKSTDKDGDKLLQQSSTSIEVQNVGSAPFSTRFKIKTCTLDAYFTKKFTEENINPPANTFICLQKESKGIKDSQEAKPCPYGYVEKEISFQNETDLTSFSEELTGKLCEDSLEVLQNKKDEYIYCAKTSDDTNSKICHTSDSLCPDGYTLIHSAVKMNSVGPCKNAIINRL